MVSRWSIPLHVHDVGQQVFVKAMLAVGAPDAALAPARVETLHRFKVLAVDVCLTEANFPASLQGNVQVTSVDRRRESVVGIVGIGDRLVNVAKGHDGKDRAENLTANDIHFLSAVGKD